MLTKINVTALDISDGLPQCSTNCALARAIARHLAPPFYPKVTLGLLEIREARGAANTYHSYSVLPPVATEFIRSFDAGEDPEPFSFSVHLQNDTLRPITDEEDAWHPEGWDFIAGGTEEGGPDVLA